MALMINASAITRLARRSEVTDSIRVAQRPATTQETLEPKSGLRIEKISSQDTAL